MRLFARTLIELFAIENLWTLIKVTFLYLFNGTILLCVIRHHLSELFKSVIINVSEI